MKAKHTLGCARQSTSVGQEKRLLLSIWHFWDHTCNAVTLRPKLDSSPADNYQENFEDNRELKHVTEELKLEGGEFLQHSEEQEGSNCPTPLPEGE